MRIAIVADLVGVVRGGIERHAELLAASLVREGHEVAVHRPATFRTLDLRATDLLLVEGVFRRTLLSLRLKAGFARVPKGLFTHASFWPAVHPSDGGTPEFWLTDSVAKPLVNRALVASTLAGFDAVFTLSDRESEDVRAALGRPLENLCVMPNLFGPRPAPEAPDTAGGDWSQEAPFVCAVARIHPRKNLRAVLEAIRGTDVRFLLGGADGGALSDILAYAASHDVSNFRYLGTVSDPEKFSLTRQSAGTVIPSFFEGVPYAALESLAVGCPVLLTDRSYMTPRAGLRTCAPTVEGLRRGIPELLSSPRPAGRFEYPSDESITRSILAACYRA
jgi:glycosyltransferase involved in cell wall biosynthesis